MLRALTIQNLALIEDVDLTLGEGLTVITGETGTGKSVLLEGLGLVLGARADPVLIRHGAAQASVSAVFALPPAHPARAFLEEQGLVLEDDEVMLRRILSREGRSRAFIEAEPVSVGVLRALGRLLVEVQGQNEQMALTDPAEHRALLDAFGVAPSLKERVAAAFARLREAEAALAAAERERHEAERDREFLDHALAELEALAPAEDEEERLLAERSRLARLLQDREALLQAHLELSGRERRSGAAAAMIQAALRALSRGSGREGESPERQEVMALLENALTALEEAERALAALLREGDAAPERHLEDIEERLFALRAVARKHQVRVAELPALRAALAARRAAREAGEERLSALAAARREAARVFDEAVEALSAARKRAAEALAQAVNAELAPLRLGAMRFFVEVEEGEGAGEEGKDRVRFLIAPHTGMPPAPLDRIASGGELSRLMLALKVVLARYSPVTTLIFDEIDAGIGGATAAAVGERLARLARDRQVVVITHSPQVAACGHHHWRVSRETSGRRVLTRIEKLSPSAREEEIARMIAGREVTAAARAAAASLLGHS
jgi:DNA repair protein RecN (Recombination protein N)